MVARRVIRLALEPASHEYEKTGGADMRLMMSLVSEQVRAEERVANAGIIMRAIASQYGVRVPTAEEFE